MTRLLLWFPPDYLEPPPLNIVLSALMLLCRFRAALQPLVRPCRHQCCLVGISAVFSDLMLLYALLLLRMH